MESDEMNLPVISTFEKHPVKSLAGVLLLGLGGMWAFYRPALVEDLAKDFVPVAQAQVMHEEIVEELTEARRDMDSRIDSLENKIDGNSTAVKGLQTEFRLTAAFQLEHSIKTDLEAHENQPIEKRDMNWVEDVRNLKRRLSLATQYKNCVLHEEPNCDLLQRQLYQ